MKFQRTGNFIFLFFCILPNWLFPQEKIKEEEVPAQIRYDLIQKFPHAEKITWLKQGGEYFGARFKQENYSTEVIYLPGGEWTQTTTEIGIRSLPDTIMKFLRMNYPGKEVGVITKITTRKYGILFDVPIIEGLTKRILTLDRYALLIQEAVEETPEKGIGPSSEKKFPFRNVFKNGNE